VGFGVHSVVPSSVLFGELAGHRSQSIGQRHPGLHPHSDGKLHDVNVPDLPAAEAGTFYVMDRDCVDFAVKTQVCCAVVTYVFIDIARKALELDASLWTRLKILSVAVFEKSEVARALQADAAQTDLPDVANQFNLFDAQPDRSGSNPACVTP
jgi:hypothetical protein